MVPLLIAMAGCGAQRDVLPDAASPPPAPMLQVPGVVEGYPVEVRLETGLRGASVRLIRSPNRPEPGPCPPAFRGACLGLSGFVEVGVVTTDASGLATFTFPLPVDAAVNTILSLQATVEHRRGAWITAPVARWVLARALDADNDGLLNHAERDAGTDPLRTDSDGGGASDNEEVIYASTDGANPADDPQSESACEDDRDGDGDGLHDCADPDCNCTERCDVVGDEDGDSKPDCADRSCVGHSACQEICSNRVDDDKDGAIDCFDDDCATYRYCEWQCDDGIDEDRDWRADCADLECDGAPGCPRSGEVCTDGVDNDADGSIDCRDTACSAAPICAEQCGNGVDDDGNGLLDCADPKCVHNSAFCGEDCRNGVDDDRDGLIDCADTSCASVCEERCDDGVDNDADNRIDCGDGECPWACVELCDDGIDNDGDRYVDTVDGDCAGIRDELCFNGVDDADADPWVDCADPDCRGRCTELCRNQIDDDLDGLVDAEDPQCPRPEECTSGADEDHDGAIDCADDDCTGACGEDCTNGADDDADGLVDCEDASCTDLCVETCTNGVDDDGDAWTDCEDEECWSDPTCPPSATVAWVVTARFKTQQGWHAWAATFFATCSSYDEDWKDGTAENVEGRVRVTHGTRVGSCGWYVDEVNIDSEVSRSRFPDWTTSTTSMGGVNFGMVCTPRTGSDLRLTRRGFRVDDGCGLTNSGFLPPLLRVGQGAANTVLGRLWYNGVDVTHHRPTYSTTYHLFWPGDSYNTWETFTAGYVAPGLTYGTCPAGNPYHVPANIIGGRIGVCPP